MSDKDSSWSGLEIAVVGMTGRFPGAGDLEVFWQNLRNGVESVSFFTERDFEEAGLDPKVFEHPDYVPARPVLEDIEYFDAGFFGFNPREAEIMDPQHRLFLECVWEALENAGYDAARYTGLIGIYAGVGAGIYLVKNLLPSAGFDWTDFYPLFIGNDKDFLPTRVSYKLNLRGPSVTVQTACSTALVALHLACRSLLGGECDMALAGGVTILDQKGYLYQEGGIQSPDGHCRAFDAQAQGTVFGSGVGVVVLKRLVDALNDGDCVHAVVKGSAINNDGALKIGYTAPSAEGQSQVIRMAHVISGVDADTISYVETHGTGTALGDPIEIQALTQAFRASTQQTGFCAIGSVKTNVGHLDMAAGAAGLIKTILSLKHKMIPPSLHFEEPNPQIDFDNSPFYVNAKLAEWEADGMPRRAGVSAFGIGGTNAHVILEESPVVEPSGPSRPWQLLLLSTKTDTALEKATLNLAEHFRERPDLNLADAAYTLQLGRKIFGHRRVAVCNGVDDAVTILETRDSKRVLTYKDSEKISARPVAFMLTGQGAQYVNMAAELYQHEPAFREHVDLCLELLRPHIQFDLSDVLYPGERDPDEAAQILKQTEVTQLALFVVEYALARLWMSWGVEPQAMIGHSIGEYVAACLAGVFSLEEALALVAARGKLMQQLPGGAMLAVFTPEQETLALLEPSLSLAAVNGPALCTVSGPVEAVERLAHQLKDQGIEFRRLRTSHAFHSEMMDPILDAFAEKVGKVALKAPEIPFISNLTGTWITAAEATEPAYWAQHLRRTVRFFDGISELLKVPGRVLLEVGPGKTLVDLAGQHPGVAKERVIASLRHPKDEQSDVMFLLRALGQLWLAGVKIHWPAFYAQEQRQRVPLPTYPFERQRYWIEPARSEGAGQSRGPSRERAGIADWFYIPSWKRTMLPVEPSQEALQRRWLLFGNDDLSAKLGERIVAQGGEVISVLPGEQFAKDGATYTIRPAHDADYDALVQALKERDQVPDGIVHLWGLASSGAEVSSLEALARAQELGFYSLLFLVQALAKEGITQPLSLDVISSGVQSVTGAETLYPAKATVLGPCRVIPLEYPYFTCRHVDVDSFILDTPKEAALVDRLVAELAIPSSDEMIAYRGLDRWVQAFESVRLDGADGHLRRLREEGVYLITGGLGGIGLTFAEHLAQTLRAKLILTGRSELPARDEWEAWLETHGDRDSTSRKIQKVQALEAMGAEVLLAGADVADQAQMQAVISQACERFGVINGVIHAAGIAAGGMMQLKTREMARDVLAPKLEGTLVLYSLLKDADLDFFMLCSSINALIGGFGQVDYSAANIFLDAFARDQALRGGPFIVSVNWDRWSEVGMAVEAARLLGGGDGRLAQPETVDHPLLGQRIVKTSEREVYLSEFNVAEQWVLNEHRVAQVAVVPGTTYLEMVRAALEEQVRDKDVCIQEVVFLSPMAVREDERRKVLTIFVQNEDGYDFQVVSRLEDDNGVLGWQRHVRGKASRLEPKVPRQYDIEEFLADYEEVSLGDGEGGGATMSQKLVVTGPRWEVVRKVCRGTNEGLVLLDLPDEFSSDLESFKFHPALADVAVGSVAAIAEGDYLPLTYEAVRIKRALPSKFYSYIELGSNGSAGGEVITADVVIIDEQGLELVEITGFSMRKVSARAAEGIGQMDESVLPDPGETRSTLTPEEQIYERLIAREDESGILCAEGVEAFNRILSWNTLSQVVVSPRGLQAAIEQAAATYSEFDLPETRVFPVTTHARPDLETAYVPPADELESKIAEVWQTILGIERVGVDDNFFELGGTSLVGIQVVSELKKVLGREVSVVSIFEAPTISLLVKHLSPEQESASSFEHSRDRAQLKKEAIRRRQRARGKSR
jgi:acyl transferase domain-containing protein